MNDDALSLANLLRPEVRANPYALYRALREQDPVHWDAQMGFWTLTRYADVTALLHDARIAKAWGLETALNRMPKSDREFAAPVYATFGQQMLYADPPYHTQLRGLVNKAFTPRVVEKMRPHIEEIADELLNQVQAKGQMDIVHDYAYPLPIAVIMELFGLPKPEQARVKQWSDDFAGAIGIVRQTPQVMKRARESYAEFRDYLSMLADKLEKNPQDNLLSGLVNVTDGGKSLSRDELAANVLIVLIGGHETATDGIGNGVIQLLAHPDQLQALRDDPTLLPVAVEEILRYESPAQIVWRVAHEDIDLDGKHIAKGQLLNLILGAANRDPAQFSTPEEFNIHRAEHKHIAFGLGNHYCVGSPLGRLDVEIGLGTLLRRLPNLKRTSDTLEWQEAPTFRGVKALPIAF
jgi:pimeloyl-[acyl-carrier protein] synthase